MISTIKWSGRKVIMIDQRKIPSKEEWFSCRGYKDVIRAIRKMVIRGAPAIGIAAAMGLALGAESIRAKSYERFRKTFKQMADDMLKARPTAVNLRWSVERMCLLVDSMIDEPVDMIKNRLRQESQRIFEEDIDVNRRIGQHGQKLIKNNAVILTHCNAGALATGGYGTALGVIRAAHEEEKNISVIADETRPWLQGLRLTSYELMKDRIPVKVIADNAAGWLMRQAGIDLVLTGADRIAANGDVANKIGTYQVAVLARENGIPFYVAAPLSTIDKRIKNGDMIPVEHRDSKEISHFKSRRVGPKGVKTLNPAFDITPAKYVTAIITEKGIIRPPYISAVKKLFK